MSRARVRYLALLLLVGVLLSASAPAAATSSGAVFAPAGFEMTRSIQLSFKRLQELWLQWLGASLQDNPARAGETLRSLQATARQLGFVRLPELALGAAARARQAAGEGDFARARRALDAAESLDPGRSDVAFTAARVAWLQGDRLGALAHLWAACGRLASPPERPDLLARTALWGMLVAGLAAALFLAALLVARGGELYRGLHATLAGMMPAGAAHVLAAAVLVGPFLVPGGLAIGVLVVSVALWVRASTSERLGLFAVWLILITVPVGTDRIVRKMTLAQSPPMRALDDFEHGRLSGTLFTDLAVLRSALPDSASALEVTADVHRTLGQWEIARGLYRQVQAREGGSSAALLNLGADAFRKGDYTAANEYFKRAAESGSSSAAAWYNLSLSYSESYLFGDFQEALARARAIDNDQVDRWIRSPSPDRVLTFNGGLERREEIGRQLSEVWSRETGPGGGTAHRLAGWLPLVAVGVAALAALLLGGVRSQLPGGGLGGLDALPRTVADWARALLPALDAAEVGRGGRNMCHGLLLAALVTLPRWPSLGGDFRATATLTRMATLVAATGLLIYFALGVRRALARDGR